MRKISDETRFKMSLAARARCTEEWRRKKRAQSETPIDSDIVRSLYAAGHTQEEVAVKLGVTQKVIWRHMKNHGINARIAAKREQRGDKNHMWKGDDVTYKAFHVRITKAMGKAKDKGCSVCGTTDKSFSYDWANLTGKYNDLNDYTAMCRSCHRQYDKARRFGGDATCLS